MIQNDKKPLFSSTRCQVFERVAESIANTTLTPTQHPHLLLFENGQRRKLKEKKSANPIS